MLVYGNVCCRGVRFIRNQCLVFRSIPMIEKLMKSRLFDLVISLDFVILIRTLFFT